MTTNSSDFPPLQLNLNIRGIRQSATIAINDLANKRRAEGKEVFKMGLGQSPFPVPECVVEELRRNAHQKDYLPAKGLPALREQLAERHQRKFGLHCTADDVLIGPGSKQLMFFLQLVYYGDLLIPAPSWVSYAPQARIIGRHIRVLPTTFETGWKPTAEQLDRLCREDLGRPRILVLNYPSNPTGLTLSNGELSDLAAVARQHHVILLSDEIYGEIHHTGDHHSILPHYPEQTIYSSGLSKWCGAGGWRLGVFVFSPELRKLLDGMAAVASETHTSVSAPIQHAAIRAFAGGPEIESYLRSVRRILRALGRTCADRLARAGARVHQPEGAFYLYPDFSPLREKLLARGIRTSAEFARRLLEDTGVALLPGSDFESPPDGLTVRLAYVDFVGAKALQEESQIDINQDIHEDFLTQHCGSVVEAIDRICEWVNR